MDELFSLPEALNQLREGRILLSRSQGKTYQIVLQSNGKVFVRSTNEGFLLSLEDFSRLFQDSLFRIDEASEEEETVDPKKDEEYYSWRQ